MFQVKTFASAVALTLLALPQAAQAANFGFVRWPDAFDLPIALVAGVMVLSFVALKAQMPAGVESFTSVPKEARTVPLKFSAAFLVASVVGCMGLVFLGMGLERAAG